MSAGAAPASVAAADHPPRAGTIVAFLIVSVVWGSTWLVIKDQISTVPPAWTITWRFVLAGAGMGLLALVRRESLRLPPGGQTMAVLVGIMQFAGNYQFVYHAEGYLTSGLVAVLFALLMVPNALLSALFLGARITKRFVAGSVVAVAGIGLLLLHELQLASIAGQVWLGAALSLAGLLCASCANVAQAAPRARNCAPVPFLAWAMLWGVLINSAWALLTVGLPVFDPRPAYWGGVAYLAILGSVLPFPLYFKLLRDMGAGKAAYSSVVTPIIAMILSTLFEGYHWGLLAVAGSVLAMIGMLIALSARRT